MKLRLSDHMRASAPEEGGANPLDAQAMDRVRDMVLEKAGFQRASKPRRGIGRRAMIALAAALALALALSTALATTDLGEKIADMFRDYGGPRSLLDSLRVYGSAVGCEAEDQGISVRIEAAYANEAQSVLALNFEDAKGRLDDGLGFRQTVSGWGIESGGSSYFQPKKGSDGRVTALLSLSNERSLAGRNVLLSIDRIVPKTTHVIEQDIGLTLAEAMRMPMPFPIPGPPGARIADIHFESAGLVIAVEYPQNDRLQYAYLKLQRATGEIVDSDRGGTFYPSDDGEMARDERGFLNATEEDLGDCRLVVDYGIEDPAIEGKWELRFRMPREVGRRVEIPINRSMIMDGVDHLVESASVYPSCVVVNHSIDEWPEVTVPDDAPSEVTGGVLGEDWPPHWPEFRLITDDGEPVSPDSSWYAGEAGGREHYQVVLHCLTEKQTSLMLEMYDGESGEVLLSRKLK